MDNFLTRLRAGSPQWGFIVSYPAPGIVERVGRDWDWVWIDGQHGQLGYQDILALVRVCDGLGRPPFVRVASHEYAEIGRTMDMNVSGLIVPMVQNAAEARRVIAAAKYPPLGDRSYGGRRVGDLRGRHYPQDVNADVIVLLQIETEEGLRNADEIAAIPGVDGLFYGPDDVLVRRGLPMDTPKTPETLGADLRTVAEACRRQGKIAATLAFTPALIEFCVRSGYRLVAAGADIAMLTGGSQQASALVRGIRVTPGADAAAGE